jgi:hypothetical protein
MNIKFGIIDFGSIPNWTSITSGFAEMPYFKHFMGTLQRQSEPRITYLPMWLWICRTKEAKVQVMHYAYSGMFRNTYDWHYPNY